MRELRQQASELVRRAEQGETFIVTVSGRAVAQLGPLPRASWRDAAVLDELFAGPADESWERDRALLPDDVRDPWSS